MDILGFFSSVNKVALIVGLLVVSAIGYEIYLMLKHPRKAKVSIPDFHATDIQGRNFTPLTLKAEPPKSPGSHGTSSNKLVYGLIALVIFVVIILIGSMIKARSSQSLYSAVHKPTISYIQSEGIFLYDKSWSPLSDDMLGSTVKKGDTILIGIKTIPGTDIDKARIKINAQVWSGTDETSLFDEDRQVYYKEYVITNDQEAIAIDGELHSIKDGWLSSNL